MPKDGQAMDRLQERVAALDEWMREHGCTALREQRHLDDGSMERIYWHYGYLVALRAVLALLNGQNPNPIDQMADTPDMPNLFH